MKTTSLHIAFAALLSLLSFASCSRNDEVTVAEGEEGKVYVTLTLSINGEEAGSRATWEDNDNPEDGNEWENTIDDLQILIYDANNNYVGKVEDLIQLLDGRYSGKLSDAEWTGNTNYKIMAFANCPSIDNPSNINTLDYTRANVSYIPMWGVTTAQFNLTPGVSEDIESIDLLRAMAKVEVIMNAEGYTIDNIAVDKSNPNGYCLPNGYNSVSETDQLDMEGETPASFKPYTSGTPESKAEDGQHYIYLPEYDNSTKPAKIQVTVNGETYDLEFKDYVNGAPKDGTQYDIVRNHIYRYTITGVNDGKLIIKYKAMLWELVTSEIGFMENVTCVLKAEDGDEEATYGILHKPTYTSKKYKNGGDYSILKPGTAGAIYRFDLKAPAGTVWTAHLSNNEDFYFSDSNYKDDKKLVSTGIARGNSSKNLPYYIQINARNPWQAIEDKNGEALEEGEIEFNTLSDWGREVESEHRVVDTYFYITVSADGVHETELEINPIEKSTDFKDNRRFPGTATRIWIRQVPAQKGIGQENQEGKETWPAQELAKNINPTDAEFQWWRVNPYWK